MKNIKLKFFGGRTSYMDIQWDDPDFDFPAIVFIGGHGFYNVGTEAKGTLGIYEECRTYVDTRPL